MTDVLDRPLVPSEFAVDSQMGEETVLLNLESGIYFGLEQMGTWIWAQLKQGIKAQEICSLAASEFGVPLQQVQDDMRAFLVDLLENGLLEEQ